MFPVLMMRSRVTILCSPGHRWPVLPARQCWWRVLGWQQIYWHPSSIPTTTGAQRGAGCHCRVQMIRFTHCELLQIYGFQGTCLAILPIFIHFLVRFQRFAWHIRAVHIQVLNGIFYIKWTLEVRASMLLVLLWCLLLRWVVWSGVVLSGDYRSCSDVSHLSPAQHSQVLIDPQDTFYNFILFLNIKWMFPPQATGQWRNMENGGLNVSKFNFPGVDPQIYCSHL